MKYYKETRVNLYRLWILRCLALGHFGWGAVLLFAAVLLTMAAFRTLFYMSTGSILTNLPMALLATATSAIPLAMLGVWMVVLGRRLCSMRLWMRRALVLTHGILLLVGFLSVITGIQSMRAAEISTAHGGGLLSPLAVVPLLLGVPVVLLAICSIAVGLLAIPRYQLGTGLINGASTAPGFGGKKNSLLRRQWVLIFIAVLLFLGLGAIFNFYTPKLSFYRAFSQPSDNQESLWDVDSILAGDRSNTAELHEMLEKPPREGKAFLRGVIMNGRLGLMRLKDGDATLALVATNIPTALECVDELEIRLKNVMVQIEKQSEPRAVDDAEMEDEYLELLNNMNDLSSVIREVHQAPAWFEPSLIQRVTRGGIGRSLALDLIAKLDIPSERRSWLLVSCVAYGDKDAVLLALQALDHIGAQAVPVVDELRRIEQEFRLNPATVSLSRTVGQTAARIEQQAESENSGIGK